jgi:hypothetical protein
VRAVRFGGENSGSKFSNANDFELKQPVRDLFDELARLRSGTIVKLEFRHGLPWLLETTAAAISADQQVAPAIRLL